jgi:hypothetical protein
MERLATETARRAVSTPKQAISISIHFHLLDRGGECIVIGLSEAQYRKFPVKGVAATFWAGADSRKHEVDLCNQEWGVNAPVI